MSQCSVAGKGLSAGKDRTNEKTAYQKGSSSSAVFDCARCDSPDDLSLLQPIKQVLIDFA